MNTPGSAHEPGTPQPSAELPSAPTVSDLDGPRRVTRASQDRLIGGVAGGVAEHLNLPALWVRAAFVLTTIVGGIGPLTYAGLWLVLPTDERFLVDTPGAEAAQRSGKRPGRIRRLADVGPGVALLVLGVGVLVLLQNWLGAGLSFWALVIGAVGVALIWRQADEAQSTRWRTEGGMDPFRAIIGDGSWQAYGRLAAGLTLLLVSLAVAIASGAGLSATAKALPVLGLGLIGVMLLLGPWVFRLAADLTAERAERIRSQERADLAAHLHDSVLQTLALIQKNSADATMVARLARSQERDLRSWLYGEQQTAASVVGALREAAATIEDTHGVDVEVVAVGDRSMDPALVPLVAATREAITNAAKHAGVPRVDVFAEVSPGEVEVFVRDRGTGFDPELVAADRHGLRDSIRARMERHGGAAVVRSAPGEGTEIRLRMPLERADVVPTAQPAAAEASPETQTHSEGTQ